MSWECNSSFEDVRRWTVSEIEKATKTEKDNATTLVWKIRIKTNGVALFIARNPHADGASLVQNVCMIPVRRLHEVVDDPTKYIGEGAFFEINVAPRGTTIMR